MDPFLPFKGLEPYRLSGVKVPDQGFGQDGFGSATDLDLEYRGLRCVGKMAFELILMQGELVGQFEENCRQLSKLRHPNIAQFLGVAFQEGISAPIQVMEFLPINLSFCIDQYRRLPKEISYSILHDVALGLSYLHSQMPPMFHGNLSPNTILLNSNLTAKLSDLGTLGMTPLQITHVTQSPETMVYLSPEAMETVPQYDVSTDEYAYGILIIHVFSGKWPQIQNEGFSNDLVPDPEVNKREQLLKNISNDHPLTELIIRCINVDTQRRAHAKEIVRELSKMVSKFPASFANRLDMLRQIEKDRHSQEKIAELKKELDETEREFSTQMQQIEKLKSENERLRDKLATNGQLIGNTIQTLQQAQLQRQSHLQLEVQMDQLEASLSDDLSTDGATASDAKSDQENKRENRLSVHREDSTSRGRTRSRAGSGIGGVYSPPPIYIAKFDFEALSKRDMSFKTDTKMFIIDMSEGNWWYARNMETLEEGYVPTNYISEVDSLKNARKDIQLIKKIGNGPCFEVWEGLWNRSVPIAIKKTASNVTLSPNFIKELEAMKALHHPNLVSFYIACSTDGILCLITELMKNGTLLEYLRQNRQSLTIQQQITVAAQVASGMAYLEQMDFAHQNLAARNVMLTEGQVCKVADYGVARLIASGEEGSNGPEYSPRWTAPEAYEDGMFSVKSDVWSYGTLLYEIITFGKFPYHGLTNAQVMQMIRQGSRIPCPRGCQQKLYDIMLSCWSLSSQDRPTFETLKQLTTNYFDTDDDREDYVEIFR